MIYVYAIVEQGRALPDGLKGIDTRTPQILNCGDVAAVISESPRVPPAPEVEKLWLHEKLIERLMCDRAVLPVRYGTQLTSERAVLELLSSNQTAFCSNLGRVRGRVELSVRVMWDDLPCHAPDAGKPAVGGRDYMQTRLLEERDRRARCKRGQALVDQVDAVLSTFADQHTAKLLATPRMLLTAAYLVNCERVTEFRAAIRRLACDRPNLQFLCTGPWPPYNFVDVVVQLADE
jgi:hypothetical protein